MKDKFYGSCDKKIKKGCRNFNFLTMGSMNLFVFSFVLECLLLFVRSSFGQPSTAADVCYQSQARRNSKDLYPDPMDCHHYYQCFFFANDQSGGIRRQCPRGMFWHDQVLQCMPEGETPCKDRCMDDATAAKGCYAGNNSCRQYYVCSNTASYAMCCPEEMRFDETVCGCQTDKNCTDQCTQASPSVVTTVVPPEQFNATVCRDSFGSYISTVPGEANAYNQLDQQGQITEKMYCPNFVSFDLTTCRCDIESEVTMAPQAQQRQAMLWLPFDTDIEDHSVNKFTTFLIEGAQLDMSTSASGSDGSLRPNNGYLSIPGLKTLDLRNQASLCAFFKCDNGQTCSKSGGILSNYKNDNEFTVVMGIERGDHFVGLLHFWHPVGIRKVSAKFTTPSNGWNHVCLTYDGNAVHLHLNGQLVDTKFVGGYLSIAHVPYHIGHHQNLGYFTGNIDDILITPFAMTQPEIDAHRMFLNGPKEANDLPRPTPFLIDGAISFIGASAKQLDESDTEWEFPVATPTREFIIFGSTRRPIGPTPPTTTRVMNKVFFLVKQTVNFNQAVTLCNARGGESAMIKSDVEFGRALAFMARFVSLYDTYWVGLQGIPIFKWVADGTNVNRRFWQPNMPIGSGECCKIDTFQLALVNVNCTSVADALCSVRRAIQYRILNGPFTWDQARLECDGQLAIFKTSQQFNTAIQAFQRAGSLGAWVNCRKAETEWRWLDNTVLPTTSGQWQAGAPTNDGNCGAFVGDFIANAECTEMKAVLCQFLY